MATPITAGNAALIRQYFQSGFYPSGAAVRFVFCSCGLLVIHALYGFVSGIH